MTAAQNLHALVHALRKEEKRYLKLFLQRSTGKSHQTSAQLLGIVLEMEVFDQDLYTQMASASPAIGHLASAQTRLLDLILKSQIQLRQGKSPQSRLHGRMAEINFLYEKRLLDLCRKRLSQAKKMAQTHKLDLQLLALLRLEQEMSLDDAAFLPYTSLQDSRSEMQEVLNRIQLETQLFNLHQEMRAMIHQRSSVPNSEKANRMASLLAQQATLPEPSQEVFRAYCYFHSLRALYELNRGSFDTAAQSYRRLLRHWNRFPDMIAEHPEFYLGHFNNYITALFGASDTQELHRGIRELRAESRIPKRLALKKVRIRFFHELSYHLYFGSAEKARRFLKELEMWLEKAGPKLSTSRRLSFWHNLAVYYFVNGSFSTANRWINHILNLPKGDERSDIRTFARLFQILVQIELGNEDFSLELIRSFSRAQRNIHSFEKAFTSQLGNYLKSPTGSLERGRALIQLSETLGQLAKDKPQRPLTGLHLTRMWAESKTLKVALHTHFRQNKYRP